MAFTTLKKGSSGDLVKALQYIAGVKADGKFGANTEEAVKKLQKRYGLEADGKAGQKTFEAIAKHAPYLKFGSTGPYVYALESILNTMKLDGVFTQNEIESVKTYQASKNMGADGIVGIKTWTALFGLDQNDNKNNEGSSGVKQPVYYLQGDKRWKSVIFTRNNTYNKKQTIGNSGCGITSMAMIIATWWDKKITPVETAKECVAKGYRTKNSGTDPGFFQMCSKKYKSSRYFTTKSYETAKNIIDQGGLVIVNVGPSVWTSGGHYIVWWKRNGDTVYINDPASKASNRVKNTAAALKKAAKGYYCFVK